MKEFVLPFLEKAYNGAKRTHQLQSLFERYKTMSPELVDEYIMKYSRPLNLVISALYSADYIVTSSEVKFELEDDDRRKEIIEFWMNLSLPSDELWYEVTHLIAYTYQVASLLRKRFFYLLDRGIAKQIAASLIADYFIRYHLEYINQKEPSIPLWWMAYLLETALCQTIFSKVQNKWADKQNSLHSKKYGLISHIIADHFMHETEGEPNPAVPIPYFKESNMFYYITWEENGTKKERIETLLPVGKSAQTIQKEMKKVAPQMSKAAHTLKYLRLTSKDTSSPMAMNFYIVHAKIENAEGWIGLVSPIDDINLKEVEAILRMKVEDLQSMSQYHKELTPVEVLKRKKEEREIIEEKIEKEVIVKKKGFFSRIFSIFKRKEVVPKVKPKPIIKAQPLDSWARLFLDELLVASVSGIDPGLEVYDAYREDTYVISGVIESQQKKTPTTTFYSEKETPPTIFYSEKSVSFPSEFLDPIINMLYISYLYLLASKKTDLVSIVPEEAYFEARDDPAHIRLVEFVMGEKLLVGILAETLPPTAMSYASDEPKYQRRSLQRKANEILTARRVNNIYDVGQRTLSREIDWNNVNESFEEKPLFYVK